MGVNEIQTGYILTMEIDFSLPLGPSIGRTLSHQGISASIRVFYKPNYSYGYEKMVIRLQKKRRECTNRDRTLNFHDRPS